MHAERGRVLGGGGFTQRSPKKVHPPGALGLASVGPRVGRNRQTLCTSGECSTRALGRFDSMRPQQGCARLRHSALASSLGDGHRRTIDPQHLRCRAPLRSSAARVMRLPSAGFKARVRSQPGPRETDRAAKPRSPRGSEAPGFPHKPRSCGRLCPARRWRAAQTAWVWRTCGST